MRCPSLLKKAAGQTSSSRLSSLRRHPQPRASSLETNFQSLAKLAAKPLLPWIITQGIILTASGTCGMSRMSSVKLGSSRSSSTRHRPQTCVSTRLQTSRMSTHSPRVMLMWIQALTVRQLSQRSLCSGLTEHAQTFQLMLSRALTTTLQASSPRLQADCGTTLLDVSGPSSLPSTAATLMRFSMWRSQPSGARFWTYHSFSVDLHQSASSWFPPGEEAHGPTWWLPVVYFHLVSRRCSQRCTQNDADLLYEAESEEFWRTHMEDLCWWLHIASMPACPAFTMAAQFLGNVAIQMAQLCRLENVAQSLSEQASSLQHCLSLAIQ